MRRRASSLRSRVSRFVFLVPLLTLACAGAAHANSFQNGEFVTYTQNEWGNNPATSAATSLLVSDFNSVYAAAFDIVVVGLPNTGFTMSFSSSAKVLAYLPSAGPPQSLAGTVVDPTATVSGVFGGDVLALRLDVDFNNAGFLKGTSNILFGNLVLTNFGSSLSGLNGLTVSQFLADANIFLGGGSCLYSISTMDTIAGDLTASFDGGTVSSFAQTNLALPGSVTPTPEPSSVLLFGVGLLGLGIFHFKRRRSANSVAG